ncbi:MAG: hypothetical protein WCU88_04925 [Elusimicrobiota bacterium]|jgi:hypothetical protein
MNISWKRMFPIFILGLVLGAAAGSWLQRTAARRFMRGPDPAKMASRLSKQLSLDARQHEALLTLLEGRRAQLDAMRTEGHQKFEALRASTDAEVRKLLTPEQQPKFDALIARWEARHKHRKD